MNKNMVHQDYIKAGAAAATAEILIILSRHEFSVVRRRVAENLNTPTEILIVLSYDSDADVRIAAGLNKSTPDHVSKMLAYDDSADVRYALAETAYMQQDLLELLAHDDNCYVAQRAKRTLARLNSALTLVPSNLSRKHKVRPERMKNLMVTAG